MPRLNLFFGTILVLAWVQFRQTGLSAVRSCVVGGSAHQGHSSAQEKSYVVKRVKAHKC
jgi:hypothetical protein